MPCPLRERALNPSLPDNLFAYTDGTNGTFGPLPFPFLFFPLFIYINFGDELEHAYHELYSLDEHFAIWMWLKHLIFHS